MYFVLAGLVSVFFFFKQKTAYEMRISDWSSDVCSSDLVALEESPMRANDEDLAKLSNAVSCAGSHFDIEHDRTRNLCLAIAAISKNVALQIFVQLLLT